MNDRPKHCADWQEHQDTKDLICKTCGLDIDEYGNTEEDFLYCCFPDCGCDGARLCMAPSGASMGSQALNIERR